MPDYCPNCGESIAREHHCPTPDDLIGAKLSAGCGPVGGIYCPDDESEKAWRAEQAQRERTPEVDDD